MIRRWPVIALIAAVTTVVGCTAPKPSTPAPTAAPTAAPGVVKEITLGYVAALSGPGAVWGIDAVNGGEMLLDQYNQAGGVKVGNVTYKFKTKAYDSKYNPAEGLAAVKRLVEVDGARYISVTGGAVVMVARDYMREKGVLGLNFMGVSSGFMGPGYPLDFNFLIPAEAIFRGSMGWLLKQDPSLKRAAILMIEDQAYISAANVEEAVLKELGVQLVGKEVSVRGTTDFTGTLTKLLAQKPDLLLPLGSNEDQALILKQAWQLGFRGYAATPGPVDAELAINTAGQGAENFIGSSVAEPLPPKLAAFQQKYTARYGKYDSMAPQWGYIGEVLPEAIKLAGTDDPKAIGEVLRSKQIDSSVWGPLQYWSPKEGDNWMIYKIPVSVIKNGKNTTVAWVNP